VELVNRKRLKEGKVPFELLYDQADVDETMKLFHATTYHDTFTVFPGLTATLHDAGHILGAATVCLDYARGGKPRRLLFTGDIGQGGMPISTDPEPVPGVNVLLTESTYGDRLHPPLVDVQERLRTYINHIVQRRSKLVIPAFSVGRTQQVLYYLNRLVQSDKIPEIPVRVDSPLSLQATQAYAAHKDYMSKEIQADYAKGHDPFAFSGLRFTQSVDESKALNAMSGPMIIISASGMCEGGRILHHIVNTLNDSSNIILFVGFQAENTLGRRIIERVDPIRILGEEYHISATVFSINALSGHADAAGLKAYYEALGGTVQQAFCIHGEPPYCEANARALSELGISKVAIPAPGQKFENV
jgi:metallo-beta-lactamase family protein